MQRRQKNWLKHTDCAQLKKTTSRMCSNYLIYFSLFFKPFKFRCCSFCLLKKKFQITVHVSCLFYFLLLRTFFKGKLKSGFFGGFYWFILSGLLKKNRCFFWVAFFTTTLLHTVLSCCNSLKITNCEYYFEKTECRGKTSSI